MSALNYAALREIQKKELDSAALTLLEENFYQQVNELLSKKADEVVASKSILLIKEYENMRKLVASIQLKREEKLALMALRGEKEPKGVTSEEREFLEKFTETVKDMRKTITDRWENRETESSIKKEKKVKILKDVDQYKGIDNNIYGPFRTGEEVILPEAETNWLLKAKMAQIT